MLSHILDPQTQKPRHRFFWPVLAVVIAIQLAALWMLCSQQVQAAEARQGDAPTQSAILVNPATGSA